MSCTSDVQVEVTWGQEGELHNNEIKTGKKQFYRLKRIIQNTIYFDFRRCKQKNSKLGTRNVTSTKCCV